MLQEKMRIEKLKVKEGAPDAEQRLFLQDINICFKPDIFGCDFVRVLGRNWNYRDPDLFRLFFLKDKEWAFLLFCQADARLTV